MEEEKGPGPLWEEDNRAEKKGQGENNHQQITKQQRCSEFEINARRSRRPDMKEWNKIDHRQDLVDSSSKSKVLKQLSIQLDLVAKFKCSHAGPPYHTEAKAIAYLFLDDSVSIEKENGGRAGKGRGQKHHTLVAANELKPVSSHIECLVTQQVPFWLTKGKKPL